MNINIPIQVVKKLELSMDTAPSVWTLKIFIAIVSAVIGALSCFPGIRYANIHLDTLFYYEGQKWWQLVFHVSFFLPLPLPLLWIVPLSKDLLVCSSAISCATRNLSISEETFESLRVHAVPVFCIFRLLLTKHFMQSYLNSAYAKVEKMRKETGRMTNIELQRKVAVVFYYLSAAALQYIAPVLLVMFAAFMLRSTMYNMKSATQLSTSFDIVANMTKDSRQTKEYAKLIRSLISVPLMRSVLSFATWWGLLVNFTMSCFGVFYLKYIA